MDIRKITYIQSHSFSLVLLQTNFNMMRALFCLTFSLLCQVAFTQHLDVFEAEGKYGFKKNEQIVVPARFDYVTSFVRGLSLVQLDNKWGYIDSLGAWKITPRFDRAEPFHNNVALVYVYGKLGLIDSLGNFVINPNYTDISEDWDSYIVHDGDQVGLLSKKGHLRVPAKYTEATYYDNAQIGCGKLKDGTYDVYLRGKLILSGIDRKIGYYEINRTLHTLHVEQHGKTGIYDYEQQKWIIPCAYGWIERMDVSEYELATGEKKNQLYILHRNESTYDPAFDFEEENQPDSIRLAKLDGTPVTDLVFSSVSPVDVFNPNSKNKNQLTASDHQQKIYFIKTDLTIEALPYISLIPYGAYFIANNERYYYILNEHQLPIDSFAYIVPYDSWDEYGETEIYPYVIVYESTDELAPRAIYDLKLRKRISPWLNIEALHVDFWINDMGAHSYTYGGSRETAGIFVQGMELGTKEDYLSEGAFFFPLNPQWIYFTFKRKDNNKMDLFRSGSQTVEQIGTYDEVSSSFAMVHEGPVSFDDFGEPIYKAINQVSKKFIVIKQDGKFGIICQNNEKSRMNYDLLENNANKHYIYLIKDGLYGSIDVVTGATIEPFSKTFYEVTSIEEGGTRMDYVKLTDDTGTSYKNSNGTEFSCLPEDLIIKKVKGKYGLEGLCKDESSPYFQVKPIYKNLENLDLLNIYTARDKNKKWGLIDHTGQTLLNFEYTKIMPVYYELQDNGSYLITYKKKKMGLVDLQGNQILPCEFDEITQFRTTYGDDVKAFLLRQGKFYGLSDQYGQVIFPCEFDKITASNAYETIRIDASKETKIYPRYFNQFEPNYYLFPLKGYHIVTENSGIIRDGDHFTEYNLETGQLIRENSAGSFTMSGNEFIIFYANGQFGAKDFNDNILIQAEYDFAEFMEGRSEVMIGYQNGIKYYIYVESNDRYTEEQW